jgi:pilus assembly protein CpaB
MNRRTRTLIVVGIAVALAAGASFGVYRAIQRIPVREVPIATAYAVVARDYVPVGVLLTADQVRLTPWPADSPVPGGFTKVEEVVGRGVTAPIVKNEPITEAKLAPRNLGGGLPPTIPPGMRAVAVRVNDVIGVAGFTVPGTHVDVIATLRQNDGFSRTVLNNVQVLTAGTKTENQQQDKDNRPIPNTNVVTLLVTPQDAEKLTLASTEGSIVLALRNPLDVAQVETPGVHLSNLLGAPNPQPERRVVRGIPRMVTPPKPPEPQVYKVDTIRAAKRTEEIIK